MSRDITKSGGGLLTEVPKLSPEMQKILQRRKVVTSYGGDDGMASSGAEFRDGVWEPPEWVDGRERDEAKQALPGWEMHLRPAPLDRIREFLMFLWNSTKHHPDMRWEGVEKIYPMMLDGHPGWCFRPERLKLAAQQAFTWFPSVQELVAFMEPDRQAILGRVAALRKVSETTTTPPKSHRPGLRPWAEGGSEDHAQYLREKQDREHRELVEIMRKRDEEAGRVPAPEKFPDQEPGESNNDYLDRIGDRRRKMLDAVTKTMRRGGALQQRADKPRPPPTPEAMKAAYGATGIKPKDVRETADAEVPS